MTSYSTEIREIRKFGIIALAFFGLLCALGILLEKTLPVYLFGFLAFLGLGFVLMPGRLRPVYEAWLKVAHFIGKIITILILTLAYYIVITPSALLKRIFGGIPIPTKPDKSIKTYWIERSEAAQPRVRFLKRY